VTEIAGRRGESSDPIYVEWRRQALHGALRVMTKCLFKPAKEGILLHGPDGRMRNCFPILSIYIADYPEQVMLTLIKSGCCPKCRVRSKVIANDLAVYPLHSQHRNNIHRQTLLRKELWEKYELINILPFSTNWPLSDIHSAISPDILHQIFKGVFKHVMTWISDHICLNMGISPDDAGMELDRRFQQMLPWPGLKEFNKGISEVQTWQGHEQKDMMRVYLGVINGLVDDEVMRAVRFLIQFIMVAEYKSHSDATLASMEKSLKGFYERKNLLVPDKEYWKIPKLHAITHYVMEIKAKGPTDGYTSNHTERAHKVECKIPYSQTNKRDPEKQMVKHIDRRSKLMAKARYLEDLESQKLTVAIEKVLEVGTRLAITPVAGSTKWIAQNRLHEEFPFLNHQIRAYFHVFDRHGNHPSHVCPPFDGLITRYPSVRCTYNPIQHGSGKSGLLSNLVRSDLDKQCFVLVAIGERDSRPHGMDGKMVAQVILLFTVKRHVNTVPLALVIWFELCGSNPDFSHGMYKFKRKFSKGNPQDSCIISVKDIIRGVHIIPIFPFPTPEREVCQVIHETEYFFINNYIDEHMYHTLN
jgi:hypothetical protein